MPEIFVLTGLAAIMGMVLLLPFTVRWVEEELEAFLLIMGILAVTTSGRWSLHLAKESITEPLLITAAVFLFGYLFRMGRKTIQDRVSSWVQAAGQPLFVFLLVVGLGLISSVITAIMGALVLVEVISSLKWDRKRERTVVILACYSIGLGAALTPIGEPLSTIATSKLAGPPHNAGFLFLAKLLWPWIISGVAVLGAFAVFLAGRGGESSGTSMTEDRAENMKDIVVRSVKIYIFIAALVLLGDGFIPVVDRYLIEMPRPALYWLNTVSAILDNATLAAAEISPRMDADRIRFLLMGLLISGGMMIPGNIPNIICASKLNIKSGEWVKFGGPVGLVLLLVYFALLEMLT